MKQFEDEIAHAELDQRGYRRMAKMTVGFARHAAQIVLGNGVTDERTNDLDRNLRIGAAGKARYRLGIEPGPSFGNVKATVARQPR
jgi:hypothetical protein